MDKRIIRIIIGVATLFAVIALIVLLNKKEINAVTFAIITGLVVVVGVAVYLLLAGLKHYSKLEEKAPEYNQEEILEKIREYLMYNKFIQPRLESEEIRFITINKEMCGIYYGEDESTPKCYYILYNLKTKLFNLFNNKLEINNHINMLIKQQYVIKHKVMGRNVFTGEERETEEMIDKDELDELKKLKEQQEQKEKLK